jgi:hypothetical protein
MQSLAKIDMDREVFSMSTIDVGRKAFSNSTKSKYYEQDRVVKALIIHN